jgi:hypothetical protein
VRVEHIHIESNSQAVIGNFKKEAETFKPGDVVEVANIIDLTLVVRRRPALTGEGGAS